MFRDLPSITNLQTSITIALLHNHGPEAAAQAAYAACDKIQGDALSDHPRPKPACSEGCSHCCRNPISATVPEVLSVARVCEMMIPGEREALIDRLKCNNPVCALLANKRCQVYDSRPLACRGCVSLSRLACAKSFGKSGSIPTRSDLLNLSIAVQIGLQKGLSEAEISHRPVLFNSALLIALTTDDVESRWLSGDPVFDSAFLPLPD